MLAKCQTRLRYVLRVERYLLNLSVLITVLRKEDVEPNERRRLGSWLRGMGQKSNAPHHRYRVVVQS